MSLLHPPPEQWLGPPLPPPCLHMSHFFILQRTQYSTHPVTFLFAEWRQAPLNLKSCDPDKVQTFNVSCKQCDDIGTHVVSQGTCSLMTKPSPFFHAASVNVTTQHMRWALCLPAMARVGAPSLGGPAPGAEAEASARSSSSPMSPVCACCPSPSPGTSHPMQ
jgi:hypothetical protein